MSTRSSTAYSPWPHRLAVTLVCATCPLIGVGSLVTTYGAGMAVPDWPSTYGYNLFLYPWQTWLAAPFDLFVEHGHRLFGALVGLITIAFLLTTWYQERRNWVKYLGVAALVLVIGQGVLGGARVVLNDRTLALLHGVTAPVFFALCVVLAAVTSKYWRRSPELDEADDAGLHRLSRLAMFTALFAYLQLVLGAQVRHIWVTSSFAFFRAIVFAHLIMAVVVLVHVGLLTFHARRWRRPYGIRRISIWLALLTLSQLLLGPAIWVMKYGWPHWVSSTLAQPGYVIQAMDFQRGLVTTAHVVNGSLIVGLSLLIAVRGFRALAWGRGEAAAGKQTRPPAADEAAARDSLRMGVAL